jgi:hypothetical protein
MTPRRAPAAPLRRCAAAKAFIVSAWGCGGPSMTDPAIWHVMAGYPGVMPRRIAAMNAKTRHAWLRAGSGRDKSV